MPTTALVTSEQYLALPDEFDSHGNRIRDELIGGEIVKMPPASLRHDRIKNEINQILRDFLRTNPQLGLASFVQIGARIGLHDTFIPDVSVVSRARLAVEARILAGPPELAVEVVSPTDTASHLKAKVDAYLANGSRSVWVVYPDSRSLIVHSPAALRELKAADALADPLLPGFSIPVSAFFDLA